MTKSFFFILLFTLLFCASSKAQFDQKSDVYQNILTMDSLLFNVGFNTCDVSQFAVLLSSDFEFIHDKDGVLNKSEFLSAFNTGLCSSPKNYQSRRELIQESSEIFPLYKNNVLYGAIQSGNHRFYETISNEQEKYAGTAKFTHVWTLVQDEWKLMRSYSYDHQAADRPKSSSSLFENHLEIENWLKENKIPTLGVGVINAGELQEVKVFGELKKGSPAPYNTLFNVASLTKPITALVCLQLASRNEWDLDATISNYWIDPDVAQDPNSKKLTTRHILSHQTGFANWRGNNTDGKLHFEFAPGTKYQYSGEGFEYLRKALEAKFGKSINELADELIFRPLGMSSTSYVWNEQTDSLRYAPGYASEGLPYPPERYRNANGADNLLTTIDDYGKFLCSVMKGEGLTQKVFEDLSTPQVATKNRKYFGLGFELYALENGEYILSHGGSDEGCQTIFFLLPKTKQGLLIFTNVDDGHKVYEKILKHYLGEVGQQIIDIETN